MDDEMVYKSILQDDFIKYLMIVMASDWLRKSPKASENLDIIIDTWKKRVTSIRDQQAEALGEDPDVAHILQEAVFGFSKDDAVNEIANVMRESIKITINHLNSSVKYNVGS